MREQVFLHTCSLVRLIRTYEENSWSFVYFSKPNKNKNCLLQASLYIITNHKSDFVTFFLFTNNPLFLVIHYIYNPINHYFVTGFMKKIYSIFFFITLTLYITPKTAKRGQLFLNFFKKIIYLTYINNFLSTFSSKSQNFFHKIRSLAHARLLISILKLFCITHWIQVKLSNFFFTFLNGYDSRLQFIY